MGGGPLPIHIQHTAAASLSFISSPNSPFSALAILRHILDKVRLLLLNCAGCSDACLLPTLGLLIYQAFRLLETWP